MMLMAGVEGDRILLNTQSENNRGTNSSKPCYWYIMIWHGVDETILFDRILMGWDWFEMFRVQRYS
jgi:hypothetical protein